MGNVKTFSFRELQVATDNFNSKRILGKGGFGNVYKGYLQDNTVVAVKRLKDCGNSGETQFQTEIEMISLAVHRNLLRLLGFCITPSERLLVYPFMSNGSVASRLRGTLSLSLSLGIYWIQTDFNKYQRQFGLIKLSCNLFEILVDCMLIIS